MEQNYLLSVVVLLISAILVVPLFKKLGLSNILGYLAAGLIIGPFGLEFFTHPEHIVHFAELGVVMFLFIIGLEMNPKTLWSLKKEIFGLGSLQVILSIAVLTVMGKYLFNFDWILSFVGASGFVMSSTAVIMQLLQEKNITHTKQGKQIVSILLFEDLFIIPLLAILALLGSKSNENIDYTSILIALVAIVVLIAIGKFVLNPLFRMIAKTHVKELMTGLALLIVLGSALMMEHSGLSAAMGAFLAGVLLSESSFKHQVEHDVEPFKGLLLGLFFMGVGMSLDLNLLFNDWSNVLLIVFAYMALKGLVIFSVAKYVFKEKSFIALSRTMIMAQGGEFAFVLYTTAGNLSLISKDDNALFTAAVILSMILTPLMLQILKEFISNDKDDKNLDLDLLKENQNIESNILVVGFGRFGQFATQALLAKNYNVTVIEKDVDMVKAARNFGFNVYYGDGSKVDTLKACGLEKSQIVLLCLNSSKNTHKILKYIKKNYPLIKVLCRSYDRKNTIELINEGADFEIRETFESALKFSDKTLELLNVDEFERENIMSKIRHLDQERLNEELLNGGLSIELAEKYHLKNHSWMPTPLIEVENQDIMDVIALNDGSEKILEEMKEDESKTLEDHK